MELDDYLIMNWADDVNYMFKNAADAKRAIRTLKAIADELVLPFSKDKCKLVPMYPQGYKYSAREEIGEVVEDLVTISKEAMILGLTWSQPRFYKGQVQLFQKNADEAIQKVKNVKNKMARIKHFTKNITQTT